jgi:hypothetical protein
MSEKPSWNSLFDHNNEANDDFLQDRPFIIEEKRKRGKEEKRKRGKEEKFCMDGKVQFDGENHFVEIPQELLDRAEIRAGDRVEVSGESLPSGYVITIERSFDLED